MSIVFQQTSLVSAGTPHGQRFSDRRTNTASGRRAVEIAGSSTLPAHTNTYELECSNRVLNMFCHHRMRDFQTWLITQVTAARGVACQFPSELPFCPGCSVYNSQAAEQVIQATCNIQNKLYLLALVFTGVITLSWRYAFPKDRENANIGPVNCHLPVNL